MAKTGLQSILASTARNGPRVSQPPMLLGPYYRIAPGIWSHVSPSSIRPARFLNTPPHCLKKNGTWS